VEEEARGTNSLRMQSKDLARNVEVLAKEIVEEERAKEKAAEVKFSPPLEIYISNKFSGNILFLVKIIFLIAPTEIKFSDHINFSDRPPTNKF
jgi:hypothetical protein